MKALTSKQPGASLVAAMVTTSATTPWAPPPGLVGQRIGIHAAKRPTTEDDWTFVDEHVAAALHRIGHWEEVPLGAVVATARVVIVGQVTWPPDPTDPEYGHYVHCSTPEGAMFHVLDDGLGDYSEGRWLWLFDDVAAFDEPVPARGRRGLWDWTPPDGWLDGLDRLDKFLAGVRALVDGGDAHPVVEMGEELLEDSTAGWLATARGQLESAVRILGRRGEDTTELVRLGERFGDQLLAKVTERSRREGRRYARNLAERILHQLQEGPLARAELADRLDESLSEISRAERVLRDDGRVVLEGDGIGQRRVLALPVPDQAEPAEVAMTSGRP